MVPCLSTVHFAFVLTVSLPLQGFTLSDPQPPLTDPPGETHEKELLRWKLCRDTTYDYPSCSLLVESTGGVRGRGIYTLEYLTLSLL